MTRLTISTKAAAELLECSDRTVRNMIERGSLKATKLDWKSKSVWRIMLSDVEKVLKARTGNSRTKR